MQTGTGLCTRLATSTNSCPCFNPTCTTRPLEQQEHQKQDDRRAFSEFIKPSDESQDESTIITMEEVVRQSNAQILSLPDHARNSTLLQREDHVDFIFKQILHNLSPKKASNFKDALHLVPTWKQGEEVLFNYPWKTMTDPFAFLKSHSCQLSWQPLNFYSGQVSVKRDQA